MSTLSPLIADWNRKGINWVYSFQPVEGPFPLSPGEMRAVPARDYIFRAHEGILLFMNAVFDSPYGGFSMETENNLAVGAVNTIINNISAGATGPNGYTYVRIPPDTPPGIYSIHSTKEQPWVETCRLYVLNSSTENTINCLGYGYIMVYITEPRRIEIAGPRIREV